MKKLFFSAIILAMGLSPAMAAGAAPYSNQPAYDPNIPIEFGSGSPTPLVPLPPHLPEYLPNGAINLDEVWIQDGGARLYWNAVIIPRQLKMAGATWIDPALVPQLLPQKQARPASRYYRKTTRTKKAKVPPTASKASLDAPAIPVPVTPVAESKPEQSDIPPLKAAATKPAPRAQVPAKPVPPVAAPGSEENRQITPPPLQ